MKKYILLLICAFYFSCAEKKETLVKESSDKKIKISLIGTKSMAFDPWILDIQVEAFGEKGTLKTEFHGEISEQQITFTWLESGVCEISLKEQDGVVRTILVKADERGIQAQELKKP